MVCGALPVSASRIGCRVRRYEVSATIRADPLGEKVFRGLLPGVEWNQDAHLLDGRMEKLGGFVMRASNFSFINSL